LAVGDVQNLDDEGVGERVEDEGDGSGGVSSNLRCQFGVTDVASGRTNSSVDAWLNQVGDGSRWCWGSGRVGEGQSGSSQDNKGTRESSIGVAGNDVDNEETWKRNQSQLNLSGSSLDNREARLGASKVSSQSTNRRVSSCWDSEGGDGSKVSELRTIVAKSRDHNRGVGEEGIIAVINSGDDEDTRKRLQQNSGISSAVSDDNNTADRVGIVSSGNTRASEGARGNLAEGNGGISVSNARNDGNLNAGAFNGGSWDEGIASFFKDTNNQRTWELGNDEVNGSVLRSVDNVNLEVSGEVSQRGSARDWSSSDILDGVETSAVSGGGGKWGTRGLAVDGDTWDGGHSVLVPDVTNDTSWKRNQVDVNNTHLSWLNRSSVGVGEVFGSAGKASVVTRWNWLEVVFTHGTSNSGAGGERVVRGAAEDGGRVQRNQSHGVINSSFQAGRVLLQTNDVNSGLRQGEDSSKNIAWQVTKKFTSANVRVTSSIVELDVASGGGQSGTQSHDGSGTSDSCLSQRLVGGIINDLDLQDDSTVLRAVEGSFILIFTANSIHTAWAAIKGAIASVFSFSGVANSVATSCAGGANTAISGAGSAVLDGVLAPSITTAWASRNCSQKRSKKDQQDGLLHSC